MDRQFDFSIFRDVYLFAVRDWQNIPFLKIALSLTDIRVT